jgi:TatD DNase family protein
MHLGIGGSITFPRASPARQAVANVPLDRLVIETDAPFLAPQSRRGTRNEPAYIVAALAVLADICNRSTAEMAEITTANALNLFGPRLRAVYDAG